MRVYLMVRPRLLKEFPEQARRAEALGYDGITLLELTVPPTLSATVSALNTTDIDLLTGIFVAFPRSPMATAYDAWSIQSLSNGRFQLGLGSQTKSHLTRRWSAELTPPPPPLSLACANMWNRCALSGIVGKMGRDSTMRVSTIIFR